MDTAETREFSAIDVFADAITALCADIEVDASPMHCAEILCRRVIAECADYAVVDRFVDDDWHRVAFAHRHPDGERLLAAIPPPRSDSLLWSVLATGEGVLIGSFHDELLVGASHDEEDLERRRKLKTRSAIAVPIGSVGAATRAVFAIGTTDGSGRDLDHAHLRLLEHVARWFSLRWQAPDAAENRAVRRVLDHGPSVVYSMLLGDPPTITYCSENVASLFGLTAQEVMADATSVTSRIHPDDLERIRLEAVALRATHAVNEYRFQLPSGHWRWVRDEIHTEFADDDQPVRTTGVVSDITDARRLREERAHLVDSELHLRERERGAYQRQAGAVRLMQALSRATTAQEVAQAVSNLGISGAGASSGGIYLIEPDGRSMALVMAQGQQQFIEAWATVPLDVDAPVGAAATSGRATYLASPEEIVAAYPELSAMREATGDQAWATLPLESGGRRLGAFTLSFATVQGFDAAQREVLELVAATVADALARGSRFDHEHTIAQRLQASLLPTVESRYPGVGIAAAYQAEEGVDVGGDWFDVLALGDGRTVIAVGDVVGRGLNAAVTMGQLRTAFAVALHETQHLGRSIEMLDRFADRVPAARCATVAVVAIDPRTRQIEVIAAGHPPVLMLRTDRAQFVCDGRGTPIGAVPRPERTSALHPMHAGERVLLYTDGLIERRGIDIFRSLRLLCDAAATLPPVDAPAYLMSRLAPKDVADDIAIVIGEMLDDSIDPVV